MNSDSMPICRSEYHETSRFETQQYKFHKEFCFSEECFVNHGGCSSLGCSTVVSMQC
jgi:hypothetical protein